LHRKLNRVYYEIREPSLTWDDIGGLAGPKRIVREMVSLPLQKRELLARHKLTVPSGVLIWGPLGVGITMLAEAAASDAGVSYVYISGQEMLGKPDEMKEAFHDASQEAPCVLYISDTEWLAPRAGADYEWGPGNFRGKPPTFADRELTETFVRLIDSIEDRPDIALVGSAYRVDTVDQAVIKEKRRFNRKVFVGPPSSEDRAGMLRIYLDRIPTLDGPVDIEGLASRTEGFVGWDIENLCKRAILNAVDRGSEVVGMEDLLEAAGQVEPWLTPDMTRKYEEIYRDDCPHHYAF
jgi:transitional endoplasmic reticulum ATPase